MVLMEYPEVLEAITRQIPGSSWKQEGKLYKIRIKDTVILEIKKCKKTFRITQLLGQEVKNQPSAWLGIQRPNNHSMHPTDLGIGIRQFIADARS